MTHFEIPPKHTVSAPPGKAFSMRHRLRLFPGEEAAPVQSPSTVQVTLGEILSPIVEAARSNHTFLDDFANDDVQISSDLYEVLMAYGQLRKTA